MGRAATPPTFVFEDTRRRDYRYIRQGLIQRGWRQEPLPHREQTSLAIKSFPWVRCGGSTGVSPTGQKNVTYPDLIWTLSSRYSPALGNLRPQQATNFFETSSCLTTKAGLCRTLKNISYGRSDVGQEIHSPGSFFPRCFDLSDVSQLTDFRDNFRQAAAASVLKVVCRLWTVSTASPTGPSPDNACRRHPAKADLPCRHLTGRDDGGGCFSDCSGGVHLWMLALAVRVCRRRLLEISGWREDFNETRRDTNGVGSLSDLEWESLLLYSYLLRGVAHTPSEASADVDSGSGKALFDEGDMPYVGHEPEETNAADTCLGYDNARYDTCDEPSGRVGLRELQGLRHTSASSSRKRVDIVARRPSSAPAGRCSANDISGRTPRLSMCQATRGGEDPLCAGCGRSLFTSQPTAPGEWISEETRHLRRGLAKIWRSSRLPRSSCRRCSCRMRDDRRDYFQGRTHYNYGQLRTEAAQLCAALERKCPQWVIDGDCNLWMLKPAGASKGRGIRVAWTLQQILHAQQTMGGRVVQKYVETPMLLPRCSPHPQLPESTARVHPEYPSRRRSHQLRRCTNHGESPGLGSCTSTQRRREEGDGRASRVDEASETEKRKAEFLTSVDAVNITRTLSNDESTSQSRSEAQRAKYHTLRCSGGIRHTGIRSREPPAARKFDIRVWVLVTGWTPLKAFVFDECYLRVCPQGFTLTESKFTDPEVHITNLSVRRPPSRRRQNMRRLSSTPTSVFRPLTEKDESSFGSPPSDVGTWELSGNESDARCRDECDGSEENSEGAVASQAELIQRLGEMDRAEGGGWSAGQGEEEPKTIGERCWRNKVFPAIEGVVRSTLLAAQPFMKPRALSFQLFGFDLHLDRELNPWLLEVNESPALSHSSKQQSALIASMCEGLLQLTVDRNSQALYPSLSEVHTDGENSYFGGTTRRDDEISSKELHRPGRWKSISTPSFDHASSVKAREKAAKADTRLYNSGSFSVQGQHLTKRGVARAERGIQEATAVNMLVIWWRSTAKKCRASRRTRSRAAATICRWVDRFYPLRKRRAVVAKNAGSAKVIQTNWRRASARMSVAGRFVAHSAACVTVQMMWRRRKLHRRCASRSTRRKVSSAVQRWATVVLKRRRKRAGETILRAVGAILTRRRIKRYAAAHIMRGLKTACNRRRHGRLLLQRFARMCLVKVRLAALSQARIVHIQNAAAIIIVRAFRIARVRSTAARAVLTLQLWYQRVQFRQESLRFSTTLIQRAWRYSRQRRLMAASIRPGLAVTTGPPWDRAVRGIVETRSSETSVPAFSQDLNCLTTDNRAGLAPSGVVTRVFSTNGDTNVARSQVNSDYAPAGTSVPSQSCTVSCRTEEAYMPHGRPALNDERESSPISFDQSTSPATTTREDWTVPDRSSAEEVAESRYSQNADDDSLPASCDETCYRAVAEAETPDPYRGTRVDQKSYRCNRSRRSKIGVNKEGEIAFEGAECQEGLLKLEDILPDLRKRSRKKAVRDGMNSKHCHGRSEIVHQNRQSCGCQRQMTEEPGSSGGYRLTPGHPIYGTNKAVRSPPPGITQHIVIPRAQGQRVHRRGGAASTPRPSAAHRHEDCRRKEIRDCGRPPFRFGVRSHVKDDGNCTFAWDGTPPAVRASSGSASATKSPGWPTCARRKEKSRRRVGVSGSWSRELRSFDSRFQPVGESGGVLETLAFLEA